MILSGDETTAYRDPAAVYHDDWPWLQGRLPGGFVLDLRKDPRVGKALIFFHGSKFPEGDNRGDFENFANLSLAWSDELKNWTWPGKTQIIR